MKMDGYRGSDPEQRRLDRVAITAAVTALYGPAARVRSIVPVSSDRESAWVRQGRLRLPPLPVLALARPALDREKK